MNAKNSPTSYDEFRKDSFFNVPSVMTKTSVSQVELPMLFRNTRVRHLNFFVAPEKVKPLISGTGLVPCRFFNGKCFVSLVLFNYQDVSICPYEELAISVIVRPEMLPDPKIYLPSLLKKNGTSWNGIGAYIIELPVTTKQAVAAGRELWGYPKFEAKIPFKFEGNRFEFGVRVPDSDSWICELKGSHYPGISITGTDLVTYANLRGKIVKTIVETKVKYKNCVVKDLDLRIGRSTHRMTETIRTLGLDHARPVIMWVADNFRSRLNHPESVAEYAAPPLPYLPDGGDGEAEGLTL